MPSVICALSAPSFAVAMTIPARIIPYGLSLPKNATIIAVKPYPKKSQVVVDPY